MEQRLDTVIWKNLTGIRLSNELLSAVVLPELGAKLASIQWRRTGFEFLAQNKRDDYAKPQFGDDFSHFDASGADDAFPSIQEETVIWNGKQRSFPDHGEIWSQPFHAESQKGRLHLWFESSRFPYRYEKDISLDGDFVLLRYRISHTGGAPFPCIWTFHGLFRCEENMRISYPGGTERFENVLESPELGPAGAILSVCDRDFAAVPPRSANTMLKFYAEGPVREGSCALAYPSPGMKCTLSYDAGQLPYLGVWITAGGYRGDYNCALEPSNGYFDSVRTAGQRDRLFYLQPEKPLEFTLRLRVSQLE